MNEDRLIAALRHYGDAMPSAAADRAIRTRLDQSWNARPATPPRLRLPRLVPVAAALVVAIAIGNAALGASADSPLWDTRVALETVGAVVRFSHEARVAYLLDLIDARAAEITRQEARGNAASAGRARSARDSAVSQLRAVAPELEPSPTPSPAPIVVPAATATPAPTPSPSPPPTSTPTVVPTRSAPPTAVPTATPATTPTKPSSSPPTPVPTPTKPATQPVFLSGTVHWPDGTSADGVCISTSSSLSGSCATRTGNGSWGFTSSISPGQQVTLYAFITDASRGGTFGGYATATITSPQTQFPLITMEKKI
jgi:hypothetical protein